jgi:hypothetical protein
MKPERCQMAGPMVPKGGCPNPAKERITFFSDAATAYLCTDCAIRLEQEAEAHHATIKRERLT